MSDVPCALQMRLVDLLTDASFGIHDALKPEVATSAFDRIFGTDLDSDWLSPVRELPDIGLLH